MMGKMKKTNYATQSLTLTLSKKRDGDELKTEFCRNF